jgi:aldehyde:ferredoxin oxidoreductase
MPIGSHEFSLCSLDDVLAYRYGIGDFLSDGAVRAAERLGQDSRQFVVHVKGQDSLDGVRINKRWGLGIALSPIGGRHLRGSLTSFWPMDESNINTYERVLETLFHAQQRKALQAHNLEKASNTIHTGFHRMDDYQCDRFYNEPVRTGPYKGERIDDGAWDRMLDEHYALHWWDRETGW